jgi:hypothetical protein
MLILRNLGKGASVSKIRNLRSSPGVNSLAHDRLGARETGHGLEDSFPDSAALEVAGSQQPIRAMRRSQCGLAAMPPHQEIAARQMSGSSTMRAISGGIDRPECRQNSCGDHPYRRAWGLRWPLS